MYAIDALKESIAMFQPDPDLMISLHEGLGYSYTISNKSKLANDCYKEALKIKPIIRDYFYLGYNYYSLGDYDNSQKYLEQFVDKVNKSSKPENFKSFMKESKELLANIKEKKFFKGK